MKVVVKVNQELLYFYWQIGKDIVDMHVENLWGKKVLKNLSIDLRHDLPDVAGLSETSLGYMKRFYLLYSQIEEICPQVVGISEYQLKNLLPGTFVQVLSRSSRERDEIISYPTPPYIYYVYIP